MTVARMAFADVSGCTILSLTTVEHGRVTVVQVDGEMDMDTAEDFLRHLRATVSAYTPEVLILDLRGLDFLGAAGITALLAAADLLRAEGGRLLLRDPSRAVRMVLRVARTHEVLVVESNPDGC